MNQILSEEHLNEETMNVRVRYEKNNVIVNFNPKEKSFAESSEYAKVLFLKYLKGAFESKGSFFTFEPKELNEFIEKGNYEQHATKFMQEEGLSDAFMKFHHMFQKSLMGRVYTLSEKDAMRYINSFLEHKDVWGEKITLENVPQTRVKNFCIHVDSVDFLKAHAEDGVSNQAIPHLKLFYDAAYAKANDKPFESLHELSDEIKVSSYCDEKDKRFYFPSVENKEWNIFKLRMEVGAYAESTNDIFEYFLKAEKINSRILLAETNKTEEKTPRKVKP